jgi:hypothetical protein
MSEPKPFASLSSGLLARKGSAKPAMRPQGFTQLNGNLEDLGWNDMGHPAPPPAFESDEEAQEHVPSSIAALTPAPKPQEAGQMNGTPVPVEQQRVIAETFGAPELEVAEEIEAVDAAVAAPVVPIAANPRRAPGQKEKAAFTLRLDQDRHLKLRLACAVKHRSAQQIVSQALDDYLQSLPELDALAQQVPARAATQN